MEKSAGAVAYCRCENRCMAALEMGCKIDRKFYYMHMEDDLPDDLLKEYELAIKNVQNISRCSILWEKRNLWDLSLR